jgi:hypothetical protein
VHTLARALRDRDDLVRFWQFSIALSIRLWFDSVMEQSGRYDVLSVSARGFRR